MVAISAPSVELLLPKAAAIGEAWARECADDLRAQKRGVVGAWPGTIREARSRVLLGVVRPAAGSPLDTESLQLLARTAYDAARRSWHVISEPDLEP